MQVNEQVLWAMVESEEVSLQTTAEAREGFCCSKCDREFIPQFGGQEGKLSGTSVFWTYFLALTVHKSKH